MRDCESKSSRDLEGDKKEFSTEKFSRLWALLMYVALPASVRGVST